MLKLTKTSKLFLKVTKCLQNVSSKEKSISQYFLLQSKKILVSISFPVQSKLNNIAVIEPLCFHLIFSIIGTRYQPEFPRSESCTTFCNLSLSFLMLMFLSSSSSNRQSLFHKNVCNTLLHYTKLYTKQFSLKS